MGVYIQGENWATQGPCPDGFHIPLRTERDAIKTVGVNIGAWTNSGGVNFSTYLKMPFCGGRLMNTSNTTGQGSEGRYWTNDASGDYTAALYLTSSLINLSWASFRANGNAIRPMKNNAVTPDASWSVLYQGSGNAGIYYNPSLGLISLSSNGTTRYTIADKNLGATTVYNYGDALSEANCGGYFQFGNNNMFQYTGSLTTSNTQIDASNYGPGNYYNSSTFIIVSSGAFDWSSVKNSNLRGYEDGNVPAMSALKNAYIGEYVVPYLCFTANTAGSQVEIWKSGTPTAVTLEMSTDGTNWSTYTFDTYITLSNVGDKVYFRNTSDTTTGFSIDQSNKYAISLSGSVAASGDITTLVNKNSTKTLVGDYCFTDLFRYQTAITAAPDLPATTVPNYGYYYMFNECSNLVSAPKIGATTLGDYCCQFMFWSCPNLETLPKLPATTLKTQCYNNMFNGCSKIKLSTTKTGAYQTAYRIPTEGTGTDGSSSMFNMFVSTGGTFTGTPTINTTYYTSNTVV